MTLFTFSPPLSLHYLFFPRSMRRAVWSSYSRNGLQVRLLLRLLLHLQLHLLLLVLLLLMETEYPLHQLPIPYSLFPIPHLNDTLSCHIMSDILNFPFVMLNPNLSCYLVSSHPTQTHPTSSNLTCSYLTHPTSSPPILFLLLLLSCPPSPPILSRACRRVCGPPVEALRSL